MPECPRILHGLEAVFWRTKLHSFRDRRTDILRRALRQNRPDIAACKTSGVTCLQQVGNTRLELLNTCRDVGDFFWLQIHLLRHGCGDEIKNLLFGLAAVNGLEADQPPPRGSLKKPACGET